MNRIVFATFNAGKVREVSDLLAGLSIEVLSPREVGVDSLPEETGETFLDNAVLKASHVVKRTGLAALADDSGLEVHALGGAPGVHSARYAGVEHDNDANTRKLLVSLKDVEDRRARFVCTVVCLLPQETMADPSLPVPTEGLRILEAHPLAPADTRILVATGETRGRIIDTPTGSNGFGYDPVFYRDDLGQTFAQISREAKNALSHRGQAFRRIRLALEGML